MTNHASIARKPIESKPSAVNEVTQVPGQVQNRERSWKNVFVVVGAFLAGLALAIGHDRFNNHLNGQHVADFIVPQDWVSRIATAFAFLVKMCLAIATTASYFQRLWRNLKTRTFEVGKVDTLVAAPTDALSFFSVGAWLRVRGLLLMGLTIWLLPLAAIITPGTLLVVSAPVTNTTMLQVPQLSYNASTWVVAGPISSDRQFWSASADMQKAGFAAAVTGEVVGALHTYANQTYSMDFHAPAIQCSPANETVQTAAETFYRGLSGSGGHIAYYSWVGGDDHGVVSQVAAYNDSSSSSGTSMSSNWQSLDVTSNDTARIFVMSSMDPNVSLSNMVTECVLHNATYTVDFSVQGGVPSAAVSQLTINEALPAMNSLLDSALDQNGAELGHEIGYGPGVSDDGTHYSYQAVMDVFGKLLVGYAITQSLATANGMQVFYSSFQRTSVNWYDMNRMVSDIETLFQNITLSMFSNENLLLNSTQASFVPVTVTVYPLTYQYKPGDLWAAYGAAVVATLIAALVGLQSMYASGASYSSRFSTAVRIVRTTGLDRLLDDADDGSDPLPKEIGVAKMQVVTSGGRSH